MRILAISPQFAHPPSDGGKVEIYYCLKAMAAAAEVHVAVPRPQGPRAPSPEAIRAHYESLGLRTTVLPAPRTETPLDILANLLQRLPFKIVKYQNPNTLAMLRELCRAHAFDAVMVTGLHFMPYALALKKEFGLPIVLREHNIEADLVRQYGQIHPSPIHRAVAHWQYPKTLRFEQLAWDQADATLFISDSDLEMARSLGYAGDLASALYAVIPVQEMTVETDGDLPGIVYPLRLNGTVQNEFSANHFIREVWAPYAERGGHLYLAITGSTPQDLERIGIPPTLQERWSIRPLGFVDDIAACIRDHRYFVSPTFFGSGMRMKLIEALGQGALCLCSGLDLRSARVFQDGRNICGFTGAQDFAEALGRLEADPDLRARIRQDGLETARRHFGDAPSYGRRLTQIWEQVTDGQAASRRGRRGHGSTDQA